jgi:hypothetical protein
LSAFDRGGAEALKPPEVEVVEEHYGAAAVERAMKVQEVIMRAMAKQITWWQAAEILGVSTRTIRRMKRNWKKKRVRWTVRSSMEASQPEARAGEEAGKGAGAVSGEVLGFQRASFS